VAKEEAANEVHVGKIQQALRDGDLKTAQALLRNIGDVSVYFASSRNAFTKAEVQASDDARRRAQSFASAHDCAALKRYVAQVIAGSTDRVVAAVQGVTCIDKSSLIGAVSVKTSAGDHQGSSQPPVAPTQPTVKNSCETMDVEDLLTQAANQYSAGFATAALSVVMKAFTCKQDVRMFRIAAMYACAAHEIATAKFYFDKTPPSLQSGIDQRCQQEGLELRSP
jgi:hypothetical protein